MSVFVGIQSAFKMIEKEMLSFGGGQPTLLIDKDLSAKFKVKECERRLIPSTSFLIKS